LSKVVFFFVSFFAQSESCPKLSFFCVFFAQARNLVQSCLFCVFFAQARIFFVFGPLNLSGIKEIEGAVMLAIRQYALMIDERELPTGFLTDRETELGSSAALRFSNRAVYNGTKRCYAADGAEFANLHGVNADFELRSGEGGRPCVAMRCHTADMHWRMEADEEDRGERTAAHRVRAFPVGAFQELEWWRTYTFVQDFGGRYWRMSVRVEQLRQPLRGRENWPTAWRRQVRAPGRENRRVHRRNARAHGV